MLGFTGTYRGRRVSVMGSGMGIPTISIYARELYCDYDVESMIRVGSCGAVAAEAKLRDVVIGMGACTDSGVNRARFRGYDFAAIADYGLLRASVEAAGRLNLPVRVGNLFSADLFYTPDEALFDFMERMGVLGVEMEAAGLYGCAAEYGKKALAICTISDHIRRGERASAEDRQTGFNDMVRIALEAVSG